MRAAPSSTWCWAPGRICLPTPSGTNASADFDQFGKSLRIDAFPVATPRLLDAAAAFPQHAIDGCSVLYTVAIAHEIVRTNSLVGEPEYRLLTSEFFAQTFNEVQRTAANLIRERL